jgi:hypothetical protein
MRWPHSQPNWNLLRESSIDQDVLVFISTPSSIDATMSAKVVVPGSTFRFDIRSIGGRFQLSARAVATPSIVDRMRRARCCDTTPPSGRTRIPSLIRYSRCAGAPSSSNAKLANSKSRVGS